MYIKFNIRPIVTVNGKSTTNGRIDHYQVVNTKLYTPPQGCQVYNNIDLMKLAEPLVFVPIPPSESFVYLGKTSDLTSEEVTSFVEQFKASGIKVAERGGTSFKYTYIGYIKDPYQEGEGVREWEVTVTLYGTENVDLPRAKYSRNDR